MGSVAAALLLLVATQTSARAYHVESPPVPPAELHRMLAEQREAEALCHPLMPVYAWDENDDPYIDCREPTENWWPGQP